MQQALPKMIRYLLVLPFFFATVLGAFAQSVTVSGRVTDEKGEGLPGVTVLLKGTTTANGTDVEGNYSLAVPATTGTLVFSYIGYQSQEVPINGRTTLNVSLATDAQVMDEVIVVGYGTVTRRELTGSVASVRAKDIEDMPVSTAAEALAGRLAGVQVTTSEGQPGAEVQIRVRGGGSLTQDNSPLYIVDGIQMENALSILSPQEIQSIDVLKDAASTSIYGARGANGVVVITTKGGKEMKTQVTYNGFAGVRSIVNKLDVMNPYDFVQYQYEIYNLTQDEQLGNNFQERYGRYEDLEIYRTVPMADWQERVFGRDAFSQTHVIGVTGGTATTSFNFTLNHADEEGIMLESGYQRTLASLKLDHRVTDRFRVGVNTRYSRQQVTGVGTSNTGTQSNNRLRNAVRFMPFQAPGMESQVDVFDPEFTNSTNLTNPVLLAHNELRNDYRNDVIVNGYFSLEPIKNLVYKTVVGVTANDRNQNFFYGSITGLARQNNDQPVVDMRTTESFSLTNSNTLNYRTTLAEDHSLDFLVGHEVVTYNQNDSYTRTKYLPVDITAEQAYAGIQQATPPIGLQQDAPSTSEFSRNLLSFFGRVNYSYRGKYTANVSVRRDGSSLFGGDNRYGTFPAAALAWQIMDEPFMEGAQDWLSNLKLRVSYGASGNNRIGNDLYRTVFSPLANEGYAFDEAITPGLYVENLANSNLLWETTISKNLGLDFSLFKSRVNGSIDFYQNNVTDLLLEAQIPQTSGYSTQLQNVGETRNRGVELQIEGVVIDKNDFRWNANFNIAFNRNTILSLGIDPSGAPKNSYLVPSGWVNATYQDFLVQVGAPIGQFFGYETDGFYTVDDFNATYNTDSDSWSYELKEGVANSREVALGRAPRPGDLKLKDLTPDNGNSMITTEDRTVLGNAQPKFTGGFNQQFTYKGFDMSIFMNFSVGNKVYNANKLEFTSQYLYRDNNMLSLMNDRWKWFDDNGQLVTNPDELTALNADTKYWTPTSGAYFLHSFGIEDGSFLRISNVTLGYTLPESIIQKARVISKMRIYATVNNLHTFTNYTGYDPEANTRRNSPLTPSVDYAAYPRSRYILGGINVTF